MMHNADCTCENCPRDCGTNITFKVCPDWIESPFGYRLRDMKVMVLGMDGFLGWPLALWLGTQGFKVSGVDNFSRRLWVSEVGGSSVVPIEPISTRLVTAKRVLGLDITFRYIDTVKHYDTFRKFLREIQPDAVVHYAECPSAPYSMIDYEHAKYVQGNNILGTLGLLFAMKEMCPKASLVKLGTMGEYGVPVSGRPIFEGYFDSDCYLEQRLGPRWRDKKYWPLAGELTPPNPPSFYHLAKAHDSLNIHKACQWWGLRSIDVMQGIIYGVHTPQVAADPRLRTRLDVDSYFGTSLNRFVAQAIIGYPLTVYGKGGQTRGYLTLEDAMQCMTRLILHPPKAGEYEVVNQMAGAYSINELAEMVIEVGGLFGLKVRAEKVENPRVEAEEHPYEPVYKKLPEVYGFQPQGSIEEEIYRTFQVLMEHKERIEGVKQVIAPRTRWK